jgi:hypothetical protein
MRGAAEEVVLSSASRSPHRIDEAALAPNVRIPYFFTTL